MNSSGSCSWWKPPGLMDLHDSEMPCVADPVEKSNSTSSGGQNALLHALQSFVKEPNEAHSLGQLHQLAQRLRAQTTMWTASNSSSSSNNASVWTGLGLNCHGNGLTEAQKWFLRALDVLCDQILQVSGHDSTTKSRAPSIQQQEIQLLQTVCFLATTTSIGYPSQSAGKLLQLLVEQIASSALEQPAPGATQDLLKLRLVLLAELLKRNAGVRIYIKEMKSIKEFYRALTILLNSTEDAELLVFVMAILARLVLTESLGGKLFSNKNVGQTFDLVFGLLEDKWSPGSSSSSASSSTFFERSRLKVASIDLLCDLASQPEILVSLESSVQLAHSMESFVRKVHVNEGVETLQLALYFIRSIMELSPQFRKQTIQWLSEQEVFFRFIEVTLHVSKQVGSACTQVLLQVMGSGKEVSWIDALVTNAKETQRVAKLTALLNGLFRCVADLIKQVESSSQSEAQFEVVCWSDEYAHGVNVCQLLSRLCETKNLCGFCAQSISLNQSAALIQMESTHVSRMDPQRLMEYSPRLAINLVILLATLVQADVLNEKTRRDLIQFLQSSEVVLVLAAGFFTRGDKELVADLLILMDQLMHQRGITSSSSQRFHAHAFAEGILAYGQRMNDAQEEIKSVVSSLQATCEARGTQLQHLQNELANSLRITEELKQRHHEEMESLQKRLLDQLRQKEEMFIKQRESFDSTMKQFHEQIETMGQHISKKMSLLAQKDALVASKARRIGELEELNNELSSKLRVLELRMEEIAQAHSIVLEEKKHREQEIDQLQEEMSSLSSEFTSQHETLMATQDELRSTQEQLREKTFENENTFKELIMVSKAHKALTAENQQLTKQIDTLEETQTTLETINGTLEKSIRDKKQTIEQMENKHARLEHALALNSNALEEEKEKSRATARELEEVRRIQHRLESELAMAEIHSAETRLAIEAKDDQLRKYEQEIQCLSSEVGKHAKLQQLIHQLSAAATQASNQPNGISTSTTATMAASGPTGIPKDTADRFQSPFLARDS